MRPQPQIRPRRQFILAGRLGLGEPALHEQAENSECGDGEEQAGKAHDATLREHRRKSAPMEPSKPKARFPAKSTKKPLVTCVRVVRSADYAGTHRPLAPRNALTRRP